MSTRSTTVGIIAPLALGLVLTGVLGYQAFDASRSHEQVARASLREQAGFAAWEFARQATDAIDRSILDGGLSAFHQADFDDEDTPLDLTSFRRTRWWSKSEYVVAMYRYTMESDELEYDGDLTPSMERWIREVLPERLRSTGDGDDHGVLVRLPEDDRLLVYELERRRRSPDAAIGYVLEGEALEEALAPVLNRATLLPPTLTKDFDNRELFSVHVRTVDGTSFFGQPLEESEDLLGSETLEDWVGGLVVELAMRPETTGQLVIGGLPRSRLPLILALLVLNLALVTIAIVQLRREAELARLRSDFVSSVSHELRTPLSQIRMFAETLLLGRVRSNEEQRRSLEIISNEAARLGNQVESVLTFSQTERAELEIHPREADVVDLVADIAESFTPLAASRGTTLQVASDGPITAELDSDAMRQALLNLLDNAVKYGASEQAVVVSTHGHGTDRVHVAVEDEGPGVPEADRRSIFSPYHRLSETHDAAIAGSGIGLAVVKRIVDAHGGRIWVEDADGGGARFVIELPSLTGSAA